MIIALEITGFDGSLLRVPIDDNLDRFARRDYNRAVVVDGDEIREATNEELAPYIAERDQADLAQNGTRYALQNQYMTICGQLTGQAPCKLGFGELQAVIEELMVNDPNTAVALSLKLLTLNAALVREGGVQWWDRCEWNGLP